MGSLGGCKVVLVSEGLKALRYMLTALPYLAGVFSCSLYDPIKGHDSLCDRFASTFC